MVNQQQLDKCAANPFLLFGVSFIVFGSIYLLKCEEQLWTPIMKSMRTDEYAIWQTLSKRNTKEINYTRGRPMNTLSYNT